MTLEYDVIQVFEATEAISQRRRRFELGDVVKYETGQNSPTVTIEMEMTFFLVDRSIFKNCCKYKNEPMGGGL